jgi:hypothetical protein
VSSFSFVFILCVFFSHQNFGREKFSQTKKTKKRNNKQFKQAGVEHRKGRFSEKMQPFGSSDGSSDKGSGSRSFSSQSTFNSTSPRAHSHSHTIIRACRRPDGKHFKDAEKQFCFSEGDMIAIPERGELDFLLDPPPPERYRIVRCLKIEEICFSKGTTVAIGSGSQVITDDDSLLVIGVAVMETRCYNLEEAKIAALPENWKPYIAHVPVRSNYADGGIPLGNFPVRSTEMEGYNTWKLMFANGKAGIF